ncbi:MAG: amino acid permease [Candidatus Micrarchaeota archaeon]|nr:amino acid permease [Candidatus Micrarchaeota archaeon]
MPLRRVVGFAEALSINIGAIIGAGIFVISGLAAGIAGPAAIVAILLGAAISILTGLSFVQLSHFYSGEGGNYTYTKRVLGSYAASVFGMMFVAASVVGGAVVALSFGSYLVEITGASLFVPAVAVTLIAVLGIVNYVGVKSSARVSMVLTIIKLAVLAVFVLVGVFYIKPGNYVPFTPNGLGSLFEAAAFIFFAYTGFARVTTLGEEVKNPKRTIPMAIIWSIIISSVVYVLVMTVLIGMAPYSAVSASQAPLEYAINIATHNALLSYIISIGALFATANVALSMILGVSRVSFAMARDSALPVALSRTNRFGAPGVSIVIPTILMMVVALALDFKQIASLSNATALLGYSVANIAAVMLTLREKGSRRLFFRSRSFLFAPILGVVMCASLIAFLTPFSLYILAAILAVITAYYFIRRRLAVRGKGSSKGF